MGNQLLETVKQLEDDLEDIVNKYDRQITNMLQEEHSLKIRDDETRWNYVGLILKRKLQSVRRAERDISQLKKVIRTKNLGGR